MVKKLKSPRRLAALAVFAIIAVSAFGFAATNTVAPSNAGSGSEGISGFDITNIDYSYTGADITNVQFDIAPAAGNVSVKLTSAGTTYTGCSLNLAGTHASCGITGVTLAAADQLTVLASN